MNSYSTTEGIRFTRQQIENRIRRAKAAVIEAQYLAHGFNFCQQCHRSSGDYLDCAHKIPVKVCLENGMAELSWDMQNIRILCRDCHQKYDKLNIQFKT